MLTTRVRGLGMAMAAAILIATACSGGGSTTTATPAPQPTATAGASSTGSSGAGDAAKGQAVFVSAGCVSCHGDKAQGNVFPGATKLAAWPGPCSDMLKQVRTPKDPSKGMPAFATTQVSDAQVNDICAWVKTQ